jgi:hypothetical protein
MIGVRFTIVLIILYLLILALHANINVMSHSLIEVVAKYYCTLVENESFTTASTTAFAVIYDTYNCYSVFVFLVIEDKSSRTT